MLVTKLLFWIFIAIPVQADLEEAEERADLSEQALAKFKAMNKSRGTTPLPGQLNF